MRSFLKYSDIIDESERSEIIFNVSELINTILNKGSKTNPEIFLDPFDSYRIHNKSIFLSYSNILAHESSISSFRDDLDIDLYVHFTSISHCCFVNDRFKKSWPHTPSFKKILYNVNFVYSLDSRTKLYLVIVSNLK